MPAPTASANLLFLREEELRQGIELLHFAARDFAAGAEPLLAEQGLGHAHYLALHFIGGRPQLTVSALVDHLGLSKQSLGRVLDTLIAKELVVQKPGLQDRRQRLLSLTATGTALERKLSDHQRIRLARAYREAGAGAVDGFRKVLLGLVDGTEERRSFEREERQPRSRPSLSNPTLSGQPSSGQPPSGSVGPARRP